MQCDGDEAGKPRFGCHKVIPGFCEGSRNTVEPNMKQLFLFVVKLAEVHAFRKRAQALPERRSLRHFECGKRAFRREKAAREISAVHRGNIARRKRGKGRKGVPVIKMPVPLFRTLHALRHGAKAQEEHRGFDQSKRMRGHSGKHRHADVCGRCVFHRSAKRRLLKIIRRQKTVFLRAEGLKVLPCPFGPAEHGFTRAGRERLPGTRPVQPEHKRGR